MAVQDMACFKAFS